MSKAVYCNISNQLKRVFVTISVSVFFLMMVTTPAHAALVCPTCQYKTIASALNDPVTAGQTIQVDPAGSPYFESNLTVNSGRSLVSLSPASPSSVIIDGGGAFASVLKVSGPATIEGFTITGANKTGPGIGQSGIGGGIATGGGTITLRNLVITGNSATSGGGVGGNTGSTVLVIDNCNIHTNIATSGTAGGVRGGNTATVITNSKITDNIATNGAGGLFLGTFSNNIITNSQILRNQGGNGNGGGLYHSGSRLVMTLVSLQDNAVTGTNSWGGGAYLASSTGSAGNVDMFGGSASGNSAVRGGGLVVGTSNGVVNINSSISGNVATGPAGSGGGIYCAFSKNLTLAGGASGNTPDDTANCGTNVVPPIGTTRTRGDGDSSGSSNDPVNTYTGELYNQYDPDINLGGPMPLHFSRYYSSKFNQVGIFADMGDNWRHNFDWKLSMIGTTMNIVNPQGRSIQFSWDGFAWNLAGKTDVVYQMSENAGAYTLLEQRGQRIFVFNSTGQLTSISDGKGNVHTLSYANGPLSQVSDGLGRVLNFSYDANNDLISVDDGKGRAVGLTYTGSYLTSLVDLTGNTTTFNYNTFFPNSALLSSTLRPAGNIPYLHKHWTSIANSKKVSSETDSNGNKTIFTYVNATTTTMTDPLLNVRTHTHTATGEFANRQDQAGFSFSMGSDTSGRRNSITDRMGGVTNYVYDSVSGKMASITTAEGNTTNFTYTPRTVSGNTTYDLTGITHADLSTETFVYDTFGNMTSHIDQLGNTASVSYDAYGQPLSVSNRLGGVTTNAYNADETLASITDPTFNTTSFAYDLYSRMNVVTHADTSTRNYTYDSSDRLLTVVDENGNVLTMTYDLNGNLASVTDPLLNAVTFAYDGNDRVLSITDPYANVTSRTYDELGRVATATDANGNITTNSYNAQGRLISVTDPSGNVWSKAYNAEAIITSATDPLSNSTTFVSDAMGRITATTTPLGFTSSVSYDAKGRVISSTDALNNITTFTRDSRGLLSGVSLPGGTISTSYTRNALGQKTTVTDPAANDWQRVYDNSGRLTTYTDPLARTQSITYDNRNRPSTITYPGVLGSVTMSYDAVGNLAGHAFSDGTTTSYIYDANNRLVSATGITRAYDANGRISNSNGIAVAHDAGGRMTSMTLAAGKAVTYAYDANDRVTSVTDWAGGVTTLTYDVAGRLTDITRPNGVNSVNTWDNDNRLVGVNEGGISSVTLTRDAKGQVTSATRTAPLTSSAATLNTQDKTYDAAAQIGGANYDAVGRITGIGADSFTWNLASLLTGYAVSGTTATATYDAQGRRLSRTEAATTRNYVWNDALGLPSISIEKQAATDFKYYIHTPNGALLYSMDATTNARNFYHYDEMGNTSFVTNDAGAVIGSYAYSPFGKLTASTGVLDNPFTWQGQYGIMDEGNGLYYVRARYYDSRSGRFISRDPVKSTTPKRVNPYQYALNNPLRFADVTGRDEFDKANNEDLRKARISLYESYKTPVGHTELLETAYMNLLNAKDSGADKEIIKELESKYEAMSKYGNAPSHVAVLEVKDRERAKAEPNNPYTMQSMVNMFFPKKASLPQPIIEGSNLEANKLHAPWADLPEYKPEYKPENSIKELVDEILQFKDDEPDSVIDELAPIVVLC